MDTQQYFELQQYLNHNKFPDHIQSNRVKKKFTNIAKYFTIQNMNLYRFDRRRPGRLLQVLRRYELESVLYMMHNDPIAGHFGREIMFNKIKTRYYWPQMYEGVKEYVKTCDSCQRRRGPSKNNELHLYLLTALFIKLE